MARHNDRNRTSRRNPSRNIKIQDRDEILRNIIDERNGNKNTGRTRRDEIRQNIYNQRGTTRRDTQPKRDRRQQQEQKKKKGRFGLDLKKRNETPILSSVFLPSDKRNAEHTSSQRKQERENINFIGIIIIVMVFIGIVSYAVVFSIKYLQRSVVENDMISYGSIESAEICNGVIVRDEVVYTAPDSGDAVFSVSDLEKVKAGAEVCTVQDTAAIENLQQDLNSINEEILEMQKTRQDISAVSDEVKQYNQQIKVSADNYAFKLTNGDISTLYSMKSDVQKNIDMRNQRLLSENSGRLSDLSDKRNEQQTKINDNIISVKTNDAGVVSCFSDGLEAEYTIDKINSLSEAQTIVKDSGSVASKIVQKDVPMFKVVRSNEWYIVAYLPNKLTADWQVGDNRTIYVHGNNEEIKPLDVQVASLNLGEKQSFVVFKSTKFLTEYINQRGISFETSRNKEGLKIPNAAIVEQTMLKVPKEFVEGNRVYKKSSGDDTLVELSVVPAGENAEEGVVYIPFDVNRLNVGEVLTVPSDKAKTFKITDVVTIKGVFVMNTGIAEFCRINLENSSSNANYTVLDPTINSAVKVYDRIVTDTLNIEKQQKLIN